jgi:glycosyltransferase involved in cell wall biosynthesis
VSILGWQARQQFEWNGCQVHAMGQDPLGSDALYPYLIRYRPNVVIALADVWWLPFFTAPHVKRQMELINAPWLLYFPIDGNTADGRLPESWVEMLREVDVPIAMSKYGLRVANQCGIGCEYIPHGVDLEVFTPPSDRALAKARVGAAGKFLVLSDSRNQPRKLLPRLLDVFARFARGRPDVLLHLHTDPEDEFARSYYYSYDVRADVRHLGIESQVRFTPGFSMTEAGGIPLPQLASYYQAADVHLLASSGEGFGLPTLQAAAAGAVPLACAYSASQELVEDHGGAIAVADWSETAFGIRRALIDVDDAVAQLVRFYDESELLRDRSARARQFALSYGWEPIVEQWNLLIGSARASRPRNGRSPYHKFERAERVTERVIRSTPGTSITVKMVQRDFGRVESSIIADARRHEGDVRLPACPPACQVGKVRVPRRPAYIGLAPCDVTSWLSLKTIFPNVTGWMVGTRPLEPGNQDVDDMRVTPLDRWEEISYDLAQSVLLVGTEGSFPDQLLVLAGWFGVPCIGPRGMPMQRELWPELAIDEPAAAVSLARALFTDSARMLRVSTAARLAARGTYQLDEDETASALRRGYQAREASLVTGGRHVG